MTQKYNYDAAKFKEEYPGMTGMYNPPANKVQGITMKQIDQKIQQAYKYAMTHHLTPDQVK